MSVLDWFVAPADPADPPEPAPPPPRAALAVLTPPSHALAVGAAVALAARAPVVACWGAASGPAVIATPSARRLAARLAERGHAAVASGRLVRVALERPAEAVRVASVAPAVLVVAGPRDDDVDRALAEHDAVLVAGSDLVADLAAQSVAALGVPATTVALADAPVARALAAAGVALTGAWRAPLGAAAR